MIKFLMILMIGLSSLGLNAQDYKLDPQTSKAIPTFHGTVILVKGKARRVNKENQSGLNLEKGQRLFAGDTIETMPASSIKFQMTDDTMIALGPNSSFEIRKYEFQDKDKRQAFFHLLRGQLRAMIHRMAKVGDLEFHTSSIAMGVRGTEFLANEFDNKTQIALLSGKLEVITNADQKKHDLVAGQYYLRAQEKIKISSFEASEITRLKASHIKEEDDFRPFLDLAKNQEMTSTANLLPLENQEIQTNGIFPQEEQWKKVLEQLNLRIKENNKIK